MQIENSNLNTVPFEQINVGDVFMDDGVYMKIANVNDTALGVLNAIDIRDGCSVFFYDDSIVHPIEGKFVVEKMW